MRILIVVLFVLALALSACDGGLILVVTATPDGQPATPAITATAAPTLPPTATPRPMVTNTPTVHPTPTQEALERGMPMESALNANPMLVDYTIVQSQRWAYDTVVEQAVPVGYIVYNWAYTRNGTNAPEDMTNLVPITTEEETKFRFEFGTRAGRSGFQQTVIVPAGCAIIKVSGETCISDPNRNDDPTRYQLGFEARVGNGQWRSLGSFVLPLCAEFGIDQQPYSDSFAPFFMSERNSLTYRVTVDFAYATAGSTSYVELNNITVAAMDSGYCNSVPGF